MNKRITLPLISVSLLVISLIFAIGCGEPEVQTPKEYVPKYSADQVIAVVKAQYPACFKRERTGTDASGMFQYTTLDTPPQISVQFVGGSKGAWKVIITCPYGYRLASLTSQVTSLTAYFWESDGALHQGYIP